MRYAALEIIVQYYLAFYVNDYLLQRDYISKLFLVQVLRRTKKSIVRGLYHLHLTNQSGFDTFYLPMRLSLLLCIVSFLSQLFLSLPRIRVVE